MSGVAIRLATPADLAAAERVVREAYGHYVARMGRLPGPMLDDYAARIGQGAVQLAERDGDVLGVLVLIAQADAMLLDNVAVLPSAQGTGVGRLLLGRAECAARDAGYGTLRLYTHETMRENIGLYGRIGYVETHRAEEHGLRRVYMEKTLD